jgi:hypothetical protein
MELLVSKLSLFALARGAFSACILLPGPCFIRMYHTSFFYSFFFQGSTCAQGSGTGARAFHSTPVALHFCSRAVEKNPPAPDSPRVVSCCSDQ